MTKATPPAGKPTVTRRGVAKNLIVVAIFLVFTLVVGVAFAYFGGTSVPGGNGVSAATTVAAGVTPSVANPDASSVKVTWTASTLATGRAVTGYVVKRYDAGTLTVQTILSACTGVVTTLTCTETDLPTGSWRYSVTPSFATNWLGAEGGKSPTISTVERDVTPPANAITTSSVTGTVVKNGNTVYYKGSAAGSFTLTNTLTDAASGPASSATSSLTGTSTGWTHTASTVSTPTGGPYVSNVFSWGAGTTSTPAEAVVGRDVQGNIDTTNLTFSTDTTGPTAAVSYKNGFEVGRSVAVTFSSSDGGSGVASGQLQRSSAPLSNGGVCGSFSGFTRVGPRNPVSVYADAQVSNATCYQYRYLVTDQLGNQTIATSANVSKVDYRGATTETGGLLSQWRLGESYVASDTFTGAAGTLLTARTGETGATWTKWVNDTSSAVLSDVGRLRRNGVGGVTYLASGASASADYQVSTDVLLKTSLAGDYAGVVGRVLESDTTGQGTRYAAVYSSDYGAWLLLKSLGGNITVLGQYNQVLTANQSYPVTLDMRGSAIRLLVDGVERLSATDSTISGAGRAGVVLGSGTTGVSPTNTTGLQTDNFLIVPRAVDSKGSNTGMYVNAPTLGVVGAINGDADTATAFDGVNEYVQMTNTTGLPVGAAVRSVEAWFKTTSTAEQVIFNYGSRATNQEFGLWLDSGGTTLKAWGVTNDRQFTAAAPLNDGAWHQSVTVYDGTSVTLYIDGVSLGSQAVPRSTVIDSYGFSIGAILVPGDAHSGGYFKGALDEVSFYTTTLDPTTVANHFALGTSAPADVAGPTGGSVAVSGLVGTGSRYSTSTTLSVSLADGTDPSGIADSGAQLLRATANLTSTGGTANGVCGTFGSYAVVSEGVDLTSPKVDTVSDSACYSYRYLVTDSLGNATTYTSPEVRVDTSAPAPPALSYSALTNAYWSGPGSSLVYYRSSATSGSFAATAAATDAQSGITSYAFPALGTNWTSTPGGQGVTTYSWSGSPAAPGVQQVTATNNASLTSPNAALTLTADNTAPTAGTVSYDASSTTTSTSVAFTTGTDSEAGLGTRLLQRASATLTGTTCGTFGTFATVLDGTNPTSPLANAVVAGNCYKYQYVVADLVGNSTTATSTTVLKVQLPYSSTVSATAGLLSYWRLGETTSGTRDTFTGTSGTVISSRATDSGASWTRRTGDTVTAVLSNQGRLRKSTASGGVVYLSSDVPASPDYSVVAELTVKSLAGTAGVVGRINPAGTGTGTYYTVRYDPGASQFQLIRRVNGTTTLLGTFNASLTVGATYRLGLDMKGTTIRMLVDDVQRVSVIDSAITAAGRAGVGFGDPGDAATPSDTAGLHLDNFNVPGRMVDFQQTNDGTYVNGPTVGVGGAISGDSDTGASFDGVSQYGSAARQISDDLSIEFWFKSTQGSGTGSQWWEGAGLVDADLVGPANDFGVSLRSDGRVVGGIGNSSGDVSIVSGTAGYNNNVWHHVVFTRVRSSGAIRLYVDGALTASGTGSTVSLTSTANLSFGRTNAGNYFAGSMDEIAVYTTALNADTVAAHYAAR